MKTVSKLRSRAAQAACIFLSLAALSSCRMPPRDAWRIIQSDGLIPYLTQDYGPGLPASRYLESRGAPLITRRVAQIPYRPSSLETRYLAQEPRTPYRVSPLPLRPPSQLPTPAPPPSPRPVAPPVVEQPEVPKPPVVNAPNAANVDASAGIAGKAAAAPAAAAVGKVGKTAEADPQPGAKPKPVIPRDPLPYGTAVPGRPGMVNSPFAQKQQLVDVTGIAPGETVKDPYSGKLFRVPPVQQAAAQKTAPAPPPKPEAAPAREPKPRP